MSSISSVKTGPFRRPLRFELFQIRLNRHLALFLPAFVFVLVIALVPIGYAVIQSVHSATYLAMGRFVGFDNFLRFLGGRNGIVNSVVFCLGSLVLTVPLGVAVAVALTRIERGRNFFRTVLILPWLLSNLAVAQLWGWLMNTDLGPVAYAISGTGWRLPNPATSDALAMPFLILAHTWAAFPLVMVMTYAALQTIPKETLEAAQVDGATRFQELFLVTLPIIKNTVLVTTILTTIHSLNNATLVLVLTGGGPGNATETVALTVFNDGFRFFRMGLAAAGSIVIFALNMVFALFYFRVVEDQR